MADFCFEDEGFLNWSGNEDFTPHKPPLPRGDELMDVIQDMNVLLGFTGTIPHAPVDDLASPGIVSVEQGTQLCVEETSRPTDKPSGYYDYKLSCDKLDICHGQKVKRQNHKCRGSYNSTKKEPLQLKNKNSNRLTARSRSSKDRVTDVNGKSEAKRLPPKNYVHLRARSGEATSAHSLSERVRREKIKERMERLRTLVPGCSKVTSNAQMLDEIINYVHCLQRQVEYLSVKLASVMPLCSFNHEMNDNLPRMQFEKALPVIDYESIDNYIEQSQSVVEHRMLIP